MASVLVNVTPEAGNLNFPEPLGAGRALWCWSEVRANHCLSSMHLGCHPVLTGDQEAGIQVVAMESQEEERDQDPLHVPKYDIQRSFQTSDRPPTSPKQ